MFDKKKKISSVWFFMSLYYWISIRLSLQLQITKAKREIISIGKNSTNATQSLSTWYFANFNF